MASSIVTTTPNGSVYATAEQSRTASPAFDRGTASSMTTVAQDDGKYEAAQRIEESPEKRRERLSSNATVASRGSSVVYPAEASSRPGEQKGFLMQRSMSRGSEKEEDAPGKTAYLTVFFCET